MRLRAFSFLLLSLFVVFCVASNVSAGGGPRNVLLVVNENSPVSQSIAAYYQSKRGIPERNVCRIRCSTAEAVTKAECEANIVAPIRDFINTAGVHDCIDYIVLTKGIPLMASYDDASWWGPVSVASVLTCLGEPSIIAPTVNPYGPTAPNAPVESFSHQLSFGGKSYYVVTRLDAYTEQQVYRMIDDGLNAQPSNGLFVLDGRYEFQTWSPYYQANDRLRQANRSLFEAGRITHYDVVTFDSMVNEFVGGRQGVMGYFSWGSNEANYYTYEAYTSNLFLPGSIADTYVSTSGRTFTYPPSSGQSLIADLIPQGLCAGNGYVSEPGVGLSTYPNVLFNRYLQGYNMGESFMAASPRLFWKAVTVGDPLMAPYATPPLVTITTPSGTSELRNSVVVYASATDDSGISKVEFYVNHFRVATCSQPPYFWVWDTTLWPDGEYTLEVIAYEDTPVRTQGFAGRAFTVRNVPVNVARIGDLQSMPIGSYVRLESKSVIAGSDAFTDCIYICDQDRSAGIRVNGIQSVATGSTVTVAGELASNGSEPVLTGANLVSVATGSVPPPLAMPNRLIGNRETPSAPELAVLGRGPYNTGLLVRTWGYVVQAYPDGFLLDDMSRPASGGIPAGIKVSFSGLPNPPSIPPIYTYAMVTGISSCVTENSVIRPIVRPRSPADMVSDPPRKRMTMPAGTILPGWNLFSVSDIALIPRPDFLFPGLTIDGCLFAWSSDSGSINCYDAFQPSRFPSLVPGDGFWLRTDRSYSVTTDVLALGPRTDVWIALPSAGLNLIGQPFERSTSIRSCEVSDGVQTLPIVEAVSAGWLCPAVLDFDNTTQSLRTQDVHYDESPCFLPWKGYWLETRRPNLALRIPEPEAP